jgi:hypothetical protein
MCSLRCNQIVADHPKSLNSLRTVGSLAECPALRKAFPESQRFDSALLHFDTGLWAVLKR